MNGEFEKKLETLRNQLDEQRKQQVTTMKRVLERQRSDELGQLDGSHEKDLEELRDGKTNWIFEIKATRQSHKIYYALY